MERVRMSVIIATWNAARVLGSCLDSLDTQELDGGFETVVVDNGSTDDTAELLREHPLPKLVITNDQNTGFSPANNQGAEMARGEILFFLNSDTELLTPDVLERLAGALDDENVGLVGPMLLNPDGSVQPSCAAHPSVGLALLVATGLYRLLPDRLLGRIAPQFWSHDRSADTDWLMGAALVVRADVFRELDGFWPVVYAEEQDLAYRVAQRGMRVRFDRSTKIMHLGNHSFSQRWSSAERAARVAAAELAFLRTHYSRWRGRLICAIVGGGYAARAAAYALLRRREPAGVFRAMARVYVAGRS